MNSKWWVPALIFLWLAAMVATYCHDCAPWQPEWIDGAAWTKVKP